MWPRPKGLFSTSRIERWLTGNNSYPISYCFLVDKRFYLWSREDGELLYVGVLDGDPDFHDACKNRLRNLRSSFATIEEAKEEVVRRGLDRFGGV